MNTMTRLMRAEVQDGLGLTRYVQTLAKQAQEQKHTPSEMWLTDALRALGVRLTRQGSMINTSLANKMLAAALDDVDWFAWARDLLALDETPATKGLVGVHCEADDDYHLAKRDPETGMCDACTAPPERM